MNPAYNKQIIPVTKKTTYFLKFIKVTCLYALSCTFKRRDAKLLSSEFSNNSFSDIRTLLLFDVKILSSIISNKRRTEITPSKLTMFK